MPHLAIWSVAVALILILGLAGDYFRVSSENARLAAENDALHEEYDSLLQTVEERDHQLESLNHLAFQISVAYGFRRDGGGVEMAYGTELLPAYHASMNQFNSIRVASSGYSRGRADESLLENTTPSIWPAQGYITSSYGNRLDPFTGKGAFHPGVDISAPYGSPVFATADGHVFSAEWEGGLGNCIKIVHARNGYRTIYGHLKEYLVRPGQSVRRGEIIGFVGNSGRTTGKHLHYEVHYKGLNINPYKYLRNTARSYSVSLTD